MGWQLVFCRSVRLYRSGRPIAWNIVMRMVRLRGCVHPRVVGFRIPRCGGRHRILDFQAPFAANRMFTIEISDEIDRWFSDADTWNRLAGGVPFRETSWIQPWWQTVGQGRTARIVIARDANGNVRGLMPMYLCHDSGTLSMMGDGDACSDHVSVLADPADAVSVAAAMGVALARCSGDAKCGWHFIDIDGVVEGDAAMVAFASGLKQGGCQLHGESRMSIWFRPASASWDDHLMTHGKTQRRQFKKWAKSLDDVEKIVAKTESQVDELLDHLIAMHQRRWNEAGEPGSYADEQYCDFIRRSAKDFLRRDRLYLSVLKHDGNVIAGELKLVGGNGVLYSYSAGYDIDYAEMEPGRLMCIDGILEMYRRGGVALDFLRGDEVYKTRLASDSRRLMRVRAASPALLPRLKFIGLRIAFAAKQWMRKRCGRPLVQLHDPSRNTASPIVLPQRPNDSSMPAAVPMPMPMPMPVPMTPPSYV